MQPRNRVVLVTYVSFVSDGRNLIGGYPYRGKPLTRYAPFHVFQFCHDHRHYRGASECAGAGVEFSGELLM